MYDHIFDDISIDELAALCNRSLTSFKKEFKRVFLSRRTSGSSASG